MKEVAASRPALTPRRPGRHLNGFHRARRSVLPLVPPLVLLSGAVLVWQAFVQVSRVPDYVLPSPAAIWQTTLDEHDLLLANTVPTFQIAVFGFALAFVAGMLMATAIHFSRVTELTLYPILIASQAVPILALAPILVILLGFSIWPKLIVVSLICFFPITVNAVDGLKSVDRDLLDMMRTFGATPWQRFREVELPSALPHVFSGARVAITFSVVAALYGEWVGSSEGLGYLIIQKQGQFDTPAIFSAMAILTCIGVLLFVCVSVLERVLLPWHIKSGTRDRARLQREESAAATRTRGKLSGE
ncbi:MAG: ABC transporter permease [Chloroflexota bacterium]